MKAGILLKATGALLAILVAGALNAAPQSRPDCQGTLTDIGFIRVQPSLPGWDDNPPSPQWGAAEKNASPFKKIIARKRPLYKMIHAPGGGYYLLCSSQSPGGRFIVAERYGALLKFAPDHKPGLILLGNISPDRETRITSFDICESGGSYYLVFTRRDGERPSILLMKYDKDLKPLLHRPFFIDFGDFPAITAAHGALQIVYAKNIPDPRRGQWNRSVLFALTAKIEEIIIDSRATLVVRKPSRARLPIIGPRGITATSLAYNPAKKEFCVAYLTAQKSDGSGTAHARIFDSKWKPKGDPVDLTALTKSLKDAKISDARLISAACRNGQYAFAFGAEFRRKKSTASPALSALVTLLCDCTLKPRALQPLYCKIARGRKDYATDIAAGNILPVKDGFAATAGRLTGGALLYRLDGGMKIQSVKNLAGGAPKQSDIFIKSDEITFSPRYAIPGGRQVLRIPVHNRGLRNASNFRIEMRCGEKIVARKTVRRAVRFGATVPVELAWSVPKDCGGGKITVSLIINPDGKIKEHSFFDNAAKIQIPVGNKGTVRGTVRDGSTGKALWRPLGGAAVTVSARDYSRTVTTDPFGRYEIDDVPIGDYRIEIKKENYRAFEAQGKLSAKTPIVASTKALYNHGRLEIILSPREAFHKCTATLSGGPHKGIRAVRTRMDLLVADLPVGQYSLTVAAPGYVSRTIPNVKISLEKTTTVTVKLTSASSAIVHGRVVDRDSLPVRNAAVVFRQAGWDDGDPARPSHTAHADENGEFRVELSACERKSIRFKGGDDSWQVEYERGAIIKGASEWLITSKAFDMPDYTGTVIVRAGSERYLKIFQCAPASAPQTIGAVLTFLPYTNAAGTFDIQAAKKTTAYCWQGLFAFGLAAECDPQTGDIISLVGYAKGLASEMRAISGSTPAAPEFKGWGRHAKSFSDITQKMAESADTREDESDSNAEIPVVHRASLRDCNALPDGLPTMPDSDAAPTGLEIALVEVVVRRRSLVWSSRQKWDASPETQAYFTRFKLPEGIARNDAKINVYLRIHGNQPGRPFFGLAACLPKQYIKVVWEPGRNKMRAFFVPEFDYIRITSRQAGK